MGATKGISRYAFFLPSKGAAGARVDTCCGRRCSVDGRICWVSIYARADSNVFGRIIEHFRKAALIELLHVHKAGFRAARVIAAGAAK
jgi:hypothetical protein